MDAKNAHHQFANNVWKGIIICKVKMNVKVYVMMGILEITRLDNVKYVNLHVKHVIITQI